MTMRTHDLDVYLIENRYDQPKEYFRVLADLAEPSLRDSPHRSILMLVVPQESSLFTFVSSFLGQA